MRALLKDRRRIALPILVSLNLLTGCEALDGGSLSEHVTLRVPQFDDVPRQTEPPVRSADAESETSDEAAE